MFSLNVCMCTVVAKRLLKMPIAIDDCQSQIKFKKHKIITKNMKYILEK